MESRRAGPEHLSHRIMNLTKWLIFCCTLPFAFGAQTAATNLHAWFSSMADRRLGDMLARADTALRTVEALRNDVKPAFDDAVSLESDAKDSWEDVYSDVKALVGSATVVARGVTETSEAVGKAAPKLAESAVGIGKSTDGIAADVHTATSDFSKPKTFWQRMKAWLETAGRVGARFL